MSGLRGIFALVFPGEGAVRADRDIDVTDYESLAYAFFDAPGEAEALEVLAERQGLGTVDFDTTWIGKTPLILALENGWKKVVKELIEAGVDVDVCSPSTFDRGPGFFAGTHCLSYLIESENSENVDMVSLLVGAGSDAVRGYHALMKAAFGGLEPVTLPEKYQGIEQVLYEGMLKQHEEHPDRLRVLLSEMSAVLAAGSPVAARFVDAKIDRTFCSSFRPGLVTP